MNIIFKLKFGSHLYGTQTENSDTDYKAIYIADLEDIILKRDKRTIHQDTKVNRGQKNSKDDVDTEFIELRKFIKDCMDGQTYALDMLFSNPEMWQIAHTKEWKYILANREKLLSRHVEPYIGYCRQQAGKYGLKGSRLGELLRVLEFLQKQKPTAKLATVVATLEPSEFVKYVKIDSPVKGKSGHFLEVLGKKFELTKMVKEVLPSLELANEKYGDRAVLAMKNEGVDFKAISHAFRCCYQLIELAQTGRIQFPLEQAWFLREIKQGKVPYVDLQEPLYDLMEKAIASVEKSDLPAEPDREFWERWLVSVYERQILDQYL